MRGFGEMGDAPGMWLRVVSVGVRVWLMLGLCVEVKSSTRVLGRVTERQY